MLSIIFFVWRSSLAADTSVSPALSHCRLRVWLTYDTYFLSPVVRLLNQWYLRWDVIHSTQAPTLYRSWCCDKSCGIQTPYFYVLTNSCRWVSTVTWEHLSRSAEQRVVNRESSSIRCFKRAFMTASRNRGTSGNCFCVLCSHQDQHHLKPPKPNF